MEPGEQYINTGYTVFAFHNKHYIIDDGAALPQSWNGSPAVR